VPDAEPQGAMHPCLDQVLDNFRKASETTMQIQQEMLKKWMGQWPTTPDTDGDRLGRTSADLPESAWLESVTEIMKQASREAR